MTNDEYYCLKCICANDEEYEAIRFLFNSLNEKYKEALYKEASHRATIRTVKAINRGKNKDIDNLCKIDDATQNDTEQEDIKGTCNICLHSKFNSSGMLKCIISNNIKEISDTCDSWECVF